MLRTRFTTAFLVMIGFFILYDLYISLTLVNSSNLTSTLIGVSFYIFLLNMLIFFGTFGGSKSDRDFLFALPLPKRSLVFSLYITRILSIGIIFIFITGYIIPGLHLNTAGKVIVILNVTLGALLLTAVATAATTMPVAQKAIMSGIFTVWGGLALPFFNFQYSYLSSLTGHLITGTIFMVAVSIPMNIFALRRVYDVELGTARSSFLASSEVKGKSATFGSTPASSIFKFYFSNINISGRTNMGGNVTVTSRGFKIRNGVMFTTALAGVYFFLALRFPYGQGSPFNTVVFLATGYMGVFAPLMLSMGVMSFERAWLSFVTLPPGFYMKNLVFGKMMQVFVLLLPFTVASIILEGVGITGSINSAVVSSVLAPMSTAIFLYLSTKLTVVQIKDTEMMPARFSIRQTLQILPTVVLFGVSFISAIFLIAAVLSSVVIAAISAYLTFDGKIWQKSATKLTERGFI